jgi:hypothetical protein
VNPGQASVNEAERDERLPAMSVVLVAPDGFESVRETIRRLKAQSVHDRLELVFVSPSANALALDAEEIRDFHSHLVVEIGDVSSTGAARASGVRAARAGVVAFAEEHCYPEPGWAEALIARHAEGWAAVAPAVSNANPKTATSRANFLISFAPWAEGAAAGEVERLPWHNASYKRAQLVEYGEALGAMLEAEGLLQADLRRKGRRLYFEPAARARHLNISRLSSYLGEQFHAGRRYAAALTRFERATLPRRLARACAAPLAVPLRLSNVWREARRPGRRRDQLPRALAPLLAGLCAHAAGEALGHALGAGDSYRRSSEFEFRHAERLSKADELPEGLPPKLPRAVVGSRAANESR